MNESVLHTAVLVKALVARLPLPIRERLRRAYYGSRRLGEAHQGFLYARGLLSDPITFTSSVAGIQNRLASRTSVFLHTIEQTVFAYPNSPYRPLLEAAGYDLARIRTLVVHEGIERTLRRLSQDGIYISIEEFKGIREARRGDRTFRFSEANFHNPLGGAGLQASSGATRSRGLITTIPMANHRLGIEHLAVALNAYGLETARVALSLTTAHGASLWGVLAFALARNVPARWFVQISSWGGQESYLYYLGLKMGACLRGIMLPSQTCVPFGEEFKVVRWMEKIAPERCCFLTQPSYALRLALTAQKTRASLAHVTFITIGEPLTPAKLAAVQAVGARAFSSLGFTEFGRVTYGCMSPVCSDDTHICRDAVAVIDRRRPVDRLGSEVDALLFTSLLTDARRVLLNVETGDYARKTTRRCGCPLEALGWTEHLEEIRSFEKLNAEGRLFLGSQLISLVEEVLPARFGGDPTDYQLVEHEDRDGFTRLSILVHPRLGKVDEDEVLDCVYGTLRESDSETTTVYREAGTMQIRRAVPMLTRAGKLMSLHHLDADQT